MSVQVVTVVRCDGCMQEIDPEQVGLVQITDPNINGKRILDFHDWATCQVLWAQRQEVIRQTSLANQGIAVPAIPVVATQALVANANQTVKVGGADVAVVTEIIAEPIVPQPVDPIKIDPDPVPVAVVEVTPIDPVVEVIV